MGVVYLGRDIYLNIDIAIKILPDSLTRSVDVAKRFAREIRL
ncbi:MAG: hypothetical protein N2746_05770 [Deltaproteobacteria bacterium]|nr:hypothetical protein [Deltaproteobacteria bacterium]